MNVSQILERTKETKTVLDKRGKELHIGDIVLVVINYGDLEKCIVTGFTNHGIKLLNLTYPKEFIYCNKQIMNANALFDKEEISSFENIRDSYVDKKVNRVLNKQVLYAFYDRQQNKYGMFVGTVRSLPGKKIGKIEYETFHKTLIKNYPYIDFYPYSVSKETFGKCNEIPINSIFLDNTDDDYNFYFLEKVNLSEDRYDLLNLYDTTSYRFVKHLLINNQTISRIFPRIHISRYTKKFEEVHRLIKVMIEFIMEKENGKQAI